MTYNKRKMDADVSIKTALSPNVVGYCVHTLEEYLTEEPNGNLDGFINYYIDKKTKEPLLNASDMVVLNGGYSLEDAKRYVYVRVFEDTWSGKQWELKIKNDLESKGKRTRFSTTKEDYIYCIDLVGDDFAIQVKPISYDLGNNPSLLMDKKKHKEAHIKYEAEFNKPVFFAFYNNKTNEIIYKK